MLSVSRMIEQNVAEVRGRMAAAAARGGRGPEAVRLVAVTKRVGAEACEAILGLGEIDLGENYPQELWRKATALARFPVRWHLIGHLQRNKARRTLPLLESIHSVDRSELIETLDRLAEELGKMPQLFLEVNTSGEATKHGFGPAEVPGLADAIARCRAARVVGLMTMAAPEDDPQRCRPSFALLRDLRDRLNERLASEHRLEHLSMGMSNDYEVAIEEGATFVRVGSALFQGIASGEQRELG